ncbi:MAG TPA: PhzF family phenazine biosynthesis protein [Allosphingosinicella sp.]|nr:PhzF family phenazine biosynthesis protein [Allosphingosinicella sp.]
MRQWTVDAFASRPFAGAPACVVEPLDAWPAEDWMRSLAAENNQSQTAFLLRTEAADRFGLRWFTPRIELPLCGAATLAAAHVLAEELGAQSPSLTFETLSGPLGVTIGGGRYAMDLPAHGPRRIAEPAGLAEAIGAAPVETWLGPYLVALLADEETVRSLRPDLAMLEPICAAATGGRGDLAVAALADPGSGFDVVSRFFAPSAGIAEDPVTGSAHCILCPLFAAKLDRPTIRFHQAYPGRGGDIDSALDGERVRLAGRAVTMIESRIRGPGAGALRH